MAKKAAHKMLSETKPGLAGGSDAPDRAAGSRSPSVESRALLGLFEKLAPLKSPEDISRSFLDTFSELLEISRAAVYMKSAEEDIFELKHSTGIKDPAAVSSISSDSPFPGWIGRADGPVFIDSYFKGPGDIADGEMNLLSSLTGMGLSYALALRTDSEYPGILLFGGKSSGDLFSAGDEGFIRMLARTLSVSAERVASQEREALKNRSIDEFARARKEFVSENCRDIRTPMSVLKSTLCSVNPENAGESILIDIARDAASRMESRLEQILSICDIEAGGAALNMESSDFSSIIEDCLREFIPELEEKGLRVEMDDRAAGRELFLDALKIKIVVRNIISHAVESERRDGVIRLSTFVSEYGPDDQEAGGLPAHGPDKGRVSPRSPAGAWVCMRTVHKRALKDPESCVCEDRRHFGQPAASGGVKGAAACAPGSGLVLAYSIVKAHEGRICILNRQDGEVETSIWLPASW